MPVSFRALLGASLVAAGSVFAFDLDPVFSSAEISRNEVISIQFDHGLTQHSGGVGVAVDADGNYYIASGAAVSKYNSTGTQLWTRFHTQHEVDVSSGGLPQFEYYENWNDGSGNINQASTHDEGEMVSPFAQKILLDGEGDVFVNFIDLLHPERSLVVKFSSAGTVLWRNVTAYPQDGNFDSLVLDMELTPDGEQLVLFEVFRDYTAGYKKTRLVVFSADTAQSDRNNTWVLNKVYGAPRAGETHGHNAIGVGLALNSNGDLYLANHEGPENANLSLLAAAPSKLVIRKLPSPYGTGSTTTGSETNIEVASARVDEEWNDLALNAAGDIYLAGTWFFSNSLTYYEEQIIASFSGSNLALRWKHNVPYVADSGTGIHVNGVKLLMDATGVTIAGGESDIRNSYSAGELALARYNFSGTKVWQVVDYDYFIDEAFTDGSGNVFMIGEDLSTFNFDNDYSVWKCSSAGVLQFKVEQAAPTDRTYDTFGHRGFAFLPGGDVAIAVAHEDDGDPDLALTLPVVVFENPAVPKISQSISFNPSPNATVGQTVTLSATATSGLAVSFELVDGPATLTGNQLSITGTGSVVVKATQAGNSAYEPASEVQRSITAAVQIRTQSISFGAISTHEFSVKGFTISASASSGLPVSILLQGPLRRSGNQIFATGLGSAALTVSQSGGSGFSAATPITRTFKIVDTTKPVVKLRPPKSASGSPVKISGTITDNFETDRVEYRVKGPDGKTTGFKKRGVSSKPGETAKFDLAITATQTGSYSVEVVPVDKAKNKGAAKKISFTRK